MNNELYFNELLELLNDNTMINYEDTYSDFLYANYYHVSGGKMKIVVRGDYITPELIWHIRYLKNKGVKEILCLSTKESVCKYEKIFDVPIITIDVLKKHDTKKMLLLIVNRKSDFEMVNSGEDYKEALYFDFRQRVKVGFYRERGAENLFSLYMRKAEYRAVIKLLEDEESKKCLIEIMRCLIKNDIYRGKEYPAELKYFDTDIYIPSGAVWINCGAAEGDTILNAINKKVAFDEIVAVEVDDIALDKLKYTKKVIDMYTNYNVKILSSFLQEGKTSIDNIFKDKDISLINMDVEGAEMDILKSAKNTIKNKKPVLAICAYHKAEDLINIPQYISNLSSDYHFFLRKYKGYAPDAVNEYIYYAVPTNRLKKYIY